MQSISVITGRIVNHRIFKTFIFVLILFSAVLIGIETYAGIAVPHKSLLHLLDMIIVWCFVVEITMKIISHGRKPSDYFRDPWNLFDFVIVAVCLFPAEDVHFVAILRIARILRVLRMITLFPKLQLLIGALLKSIPSMGYVILLLSLLFYIYGIMGSFLFGHRDPLHFGNLHLSLITLFKVLTLEGWTDILNIHLYEQGTIQKVPVEVTSVWPFLYFVSFILIGAMIIMNLFIGVIMNSMEESQREMEQLLQDKELQKNSTESLFRNIDFKIDELKKEIMGLKNKLN